jgi:KUP system potassium uptake protein
LLIGIVAFTVFTTWQRGRVLVTRIRVRDEGLLPAFIDKLRTVQPPLQRVPGTAVFLNRGKDTTPLALRANVEHNHVLHKYVIVLSIETLPVPHVPVEQRLSIDPLGYTDDHISHVAARFGYMDQPIVPPLLSMIRGADVEGIRDDSDVTYFLSTIELHRGNSRDLSRWRKQLFLATSHATADAAEYFGLPRDRTVMMGSRIDL